MQSMWRDNEKSRQSTDSVCVPGHGRIHDMSLAEQIVMDFHLPLLTHSASEVLNDVYTCLSDYNSPAVWGFHKKTDPDV